MKRTWLNLILLVALTAACTPGVTGTQIAISPQEPVSTTQPAVAIANPASVNCIEKGGTLSIQKQGDGGEYGVCVFPDNLQCEEWAMMRGDCPLGGIKVTGYVTPAAVYCAITGGTYTVRSESNTDSEQGDCTFKDGSVCDAWEYYNGKCSPGS